MPSLTRSLKRRFCRHLSLRSPKGPRTTTARDAGARAPPKASRAKKRHGAPEAPPRGKAVRGGSASRRSLTRRPTGFGQGQGGGRICPPLSGRRRGLEQGRQPPPCSFPGRGGIGSAPPHPPNETNETRRRRRTPAVNKDAASPRSLAHLSTPKPRTSLVCSWTDQSYGYPYRSTAAGPRARPSRKT